MDRGNNDPIAELLTVPLPDVLSNLHSGSAIICHYLLWAVTVLFPRQRVLDAQVEQLEGALGSLPGGDISVSTECKCGLKE